MRAVGALGEAEAVPADDRAILQDHPMADAAGLANHRMRVRQEIVSNRHPAIDDSMGKQDRFLPDFNVLLNDDIRPDVRAGLNPGGRMDHCGRMNSRSILRRPVEKLESACKIQIRILAAQHRRGKSREVLGDDDCGGLGTTRVRGVLGVRNKCQLPRPSSLDRRNPGDFDVR